MSNLKVGLSPRFMMQQKGQNKNPSSGGITTKYMSKDFKKYKPSQKQTHLQTAQCQPINQSLQKSLPYQRSPTEKWRKNKGEGITMYIKNRAESYKPKACAYL